MLISELACRINLSSTHKMKKLYFTLLTCILPTISSIAQTTATDFTATDCNSVSHNLFTELNAGKVVVMVWVDPCASCISDAIASYNAVQSFATSNPGKVLYWFSDDIGNTPCSSLSAWATTNSIGPANMTTFGNVGLTIDEANYGGTGMPHVVVMGGNNHHIFYNQRNGSNDGVAITNAITQALSSTAVAAVTNNNEGLQVFPNPGDGIINIKYTNNTYSQARIGIYNVSGSLVQDIVVTNQQPGTNAIQINPDASLADGVYYIKIITGQETQTAKLVIAK